MFRFFILLMTTLVFGGVAYAETPTGATGILIAKSKKKSKKKSSTREKIISREKTYSRSKTNVDFDAVDITGQTRNPMGSLIKRTNSDNDYDFIRIRKRWHPEMIQSTSGLETGAR